MTTHQQHKEEDFGDFEETDTENKPLIASPDAPVRVRMPRGNQMLGIIAQRLGGNRMEVRTTSGKVMNCRVPGRFKRNMWLRPKDIVLVEPWEHDADKGDVVLKYNSSEITQLRKKGILASLNTDF